MERIVDFPIWIKGYLELIVRRHHVTRVVTGDAQQASHVSYTNTTPREEQRT
jgi:hypothetical protein